MVPKFLEQSIHSCDLWIGEAQCSQNIEMLYKKLDILFSFLCL